MEQKKLVVMRNVLKEYGIEDYKLHVLNKVRKLVPIVRSCYDMFLQHDDDYLASIFAIDGLFLLNLFNTYNRPVEEYMDEYPRRKELPKVGPKKRFVAQDILMVENQIPMMVLKEIYLTLHASSGNFSPSIFRMFCKIHSPLKLCPESLAPSTADHLLHYMYYSIVNNVYKGPDESDKREQPNDVHKCDLCLWRRPRQRMSVTLAYKFITNIPREEIAQAYEQTISVLETLCQTKFLIPSASNLRDKAGFQFYSLPEDQGIQNIHVRGKDIYLPKITLNNDSEVILRNLVAYETLTTNPDTLPLNEYMGFICGLIMNKEDADYLKSQNVIAGDLDANNIVELFTGISSSIQTAKIEGNYYSILRETMKEINKVYESGLRIKTYLLLKKLARRLLVVLRAIGGLVESTWKVVAFIVSIVAVFLLTLQAYCDVYGCK